MPQAVLSTPLGIGPYVEAAFFHRASKTLLVTDTVVCIPTEPPEARKRGPVTATDASRLSGPLLRTALRHAPLTRGGSPPPLISFAPFSGVRRRP